FSRDWSSDVCSSDLLALRFGERRVVVVAPLQELGIDVRDDLVVLGYKRLDPLDYGVGVLSDGDNDLGRRIGPVKRIRHPAGGELVGRTLDQDYVVLDNGVL